MYLNIGGDFSVRSESVVGVFDLDNTSCSKWTRKFLTEAQKAGAVTLNVGLFVNALISFIIVAFAVFILIKAINELQAKMLRQEAAEEAKKEPVTKACPYCCEEIPVKAVRCPHCTSELK